MLVIQNANLPLFKMKTRLKPGGGEGDGDSLSEGLTEALGLTLALGDIDKDGL